MRKLSFLLILQIFICYCGVAQKAQFEFYSTANGLIGNNTSPVTQDAQGLLWFVNDGKLVRYDGRTFLPFPPPPTELSGKNEPLIGVSSYQDSLLFVMSEHFFYLFHPQNKNWQIIEGKDQNVVWDWFKVSDDHIILLTSNNVIDLECWSFKNGKLSNHAFANFPKLTNNYNWIGTDSKSDIFLTAQDTLYKFDENGNPLSKLSLKNICTNCYNYCFQFDDKDNLILMMNWNFYILDHFNNVFTPHPANRFLQKGENHLHRFLLEQDGSIWACGQDRNLVHYDASKDTLYNYTNQVKELLPNTNDLKDIFKDKSGVLWLNTRLGLLKILPKSYPFEQYLSEPDDSKTLFSFRGMTEDKSGNIFGFYYDGMAKIDPTQSKVLKTSEFDFPLNTFNLFSEDSQIWVNGKQFWNDDSNQLLDVSSDKIIFDGHDDCGFFTKDNDQKLWWADHHALYFLEKKGSSDHWKLELELAESQDVLNKTEALHFGKFNQKLWISFDGKLLKYDTKTKAQTWFAPSKWSRVLEIEETESESLWLATDIGLVKFNPKTKEADYYSVNDGLPHNFVCGMLTEGDSVLWLSTNHGLSRFHIPSKIFINFFEKDGLTHNEFNRASYLKAKDGRMYFGGLRGINAFYPKEVMKTFNEKNNTEAQLILTNFECTDDRNDSPKKVVKPVHQKEIHIYHWEWSYNFEFVLTDYHNPSEILYSHQMQGYKDTWSEPSKFNFVRYNNLPPGDFTFRVKARNPEGAWNPNELAIKVIVHPPWWKTNLAYFGYLLLLIAIIASIIYFLKKRWALQNQLQFEQQEAIRLKELDNFKSKLYTNLTHEFRTPLTVILGMVGQIKNEPNKYLDEGTRLIEANGKSLLQLINQLLDLSKLEDKSFRLNYEHGDIIPYLRYVVESFQTYANSKNLLLRFFTTLEGLNMSYDAEQIKQILTNLISNAIKFTPSGGEIIVKVEQENSSLKITVKDNGIGISEKELPNIFDRFYQVDSSSTREGEGTGIGLAHAKELVKLMEGVISVESKLDEGTEFMVQLPIESSNELAKMKSIQPYSQKENISISINSNASNSKSIENKSNLSPDAPSLLIIEDNADVVTYLKSCLSRLYQIDVAYNGRIGIDKALEHIPDIIISDVMMPEKDGFEVCDFLKNDERTSHIPIILLTAKADVSSKLVGLKRGADVYLSKPFVKEELLIRLENLVARQKKMVAYFAQQKLSIENTLVKNELDEALKFEDAFIQKLKKVIGENYSDENFSLPQLCQKIQMSRSQLFRKMKALVGISPSDFIRKYRLEKAKELLESSQINVSEVAWKVGFKDLSHFSKAFHKEFGHSPSKKII